MGKSLEHCFVVDCSDSRNIFVYDRLKALGFKVSTLSENLSDTSMTFVYLFAPSLVIDNIIVEDIKDNSIVFLTRIDDENKLALYKKGVKVFCYFDDEQLVSANAKLTAEGAVAYVILNTSISLESMKIAILGGGRIAKAIAGYLKTMGAVVTIAVRRESEFDKLKAVADTAVNFVDIEKDLKSFDCIVNTVPAMVLDKRQLFRLKRGCFVLDLASKPGGVNFDVAKELRLSYIHALGVPGKIMPETAGGLMVKSVLERLGLLGG